MGGALNVKQEQSDRRQKHLDHSLQIPKAGDLLWRLLHGRVLTGTQLSWIDPALWYCPSHHCDLTIQHVWMECSVAEAVWGKCPGYGLI